MIALPRIYHQIFQKGILLSINSTKMLFEDMKARYGIRFLMTFKLNQDCLENLFAQVRQNGGPNTHPTPLDALNRLRLIILGRGLRTQLRRNQNCQEIMIDENFVICEIFKKACIDRDEGDSYEDDEDVVVCKPADRNLEEEDGFCYAMGYVARKLHDEYPDLGKYTYQLEAEKENYVNDISYGGLTAPSESWLENAEKMDTCFNALHNGSDNIGFKETKNIKKRTTRVLKDKFPDIPEKIVKQFVTTRVNIRVRHTKKKLRETKYMKYKTGHSTDKKSSTVRKNALKLKHFRH